MPIDDKKIAELRETLKTDPGAAACVDLARILIEQDDMRAEAREVLFAGLAKDPHNSLARLLLARAFYLDDLLEFAVRELVELQKHSQVPSLQKLLDAFGAFAMPYLPTSSSKAEGSDSGDEHTEESQEESGEEEIEVLAEIDIDDDFLEALDELEEED